MAGNLVVARYSDGRVVKGTTVDFLPGRDVMHVQAENGEITLVHHSDLKAVFFVRSLRGNPSHSESNRFDPDRPVPGRKLRVVFADGEVLIGTTQGYQPNRPGFFLIPADPDSNTERCFVITASTREVQLL